jgi:hypothetical protein
MKTIELDWDNRPIKVKNPLYPQCDCGMCPRNYWVGIWCGSRASGKTYNCVNLLRHYETNGIKDKGGQKVDQRVILFSPTFAANLVWNSLKYLDEDDVHEIYSDEKLQEVIEDVKFEKEMTDKYKKELEVYNKYVNCKDLRELSDAEIILLSMKDCQPPMKPRYPNGCGVPNFR